MTGLTEQRIFFARNLTFHTDPWTHCGPPSRNSTYKGSCKYLWFSTVNDTLMDDGFFFRLMNHHRTSLTTCLHFKHPKLWSYMVSWTGIWVLILSMLQMPFPGGMNTSTFTLAFIRWHWIICQSLVCYEVPLFYNIPDDSLTHFLATSADVECTFSQGHLLLSHVCICLSVQSTWTLLCVGVWSLLGYVKDNDIKAVTILPEVDSDEEGQLPENWNSI